MQKLGFDAVGVLQLVWTRGIAALTRFGGPPSLINLVYSVNFGASKSSQPGLSTAIPEGELEHLLSDGTISL